MDAHSKYLFDTLGFLVVKDVLSREQLETLNAAIDRKPDHFFQRTDSLRNSSRGTSGRKDCGSFMQWPATDGGDIFRSLLCHPKLHPIINSLCGQGHRLDHKPVLFIQQPLAEGFDLHGGAVNTQGHYNFPISYHCHAGQIVCNLINVAVQLTASPHGAGGFQIIPGSHKANFPPPSGPDALQTLADTYALQPACEAGDVIIFAEAALHGAAVRNAPTERRVALFRFAPATCAYARGYLDEEDRALLTPAQKAIVTPPYHIDQDRLVPQDNGNVNIPHPRKSEKKIFDQAVFGNNYY
jgi:ectoine hydroxylase-related dioxygenase (phytanoyl-CoA dioxygenase family)